MMICRARVPVPSGNWKDVSELLRGSSGLSHLDL